MRFALTFIALLMTVLLVAQTGGPDAFGYTWANSNAASGPAYDWIELANPTTLTGVIDDWVSAQLPIGFNFPFYGQTFDYVYVCSNGIIGFDNTNLSVWENMTIPTAAAPGNFIGWFWDDMNPTYSWANAALKYEAVMYNGMNAFVVTAENMPEYNDDGSYPNNCMQGQVVLIEDGTILVQYDWFGASFDRAHASVGIENADGSIGLQYCYGDVSLLTDDLAILFSPPQMYDNDLAATAIQGNPYPTVGEQETWLVTIKNTGLNSQTDYTIKLLDSNDNEIQEIDGIPLSSGSSIDIPVTWETDNLELAGVYAQVILVDDENEDNNTTELMSVAVQAEGVDTGVVGFGDEQERFPFDFYYRAGLTETIYAADIMDVSSGWLTQLGWQANFYEPCWDMPVRIWVGETIETNLENGWIGSDDLQLVYDGLLDFPAGQTTVLAPLQSFYEYQGGNLVTLIEHVQTSDASSSENIFACTSVAAGTGCARAWQSDVDPADPADTEGGQLLDMRPNTHLFFTVGQTDVTVHPWSANGVVYGYVHVTLTGDETHESNCWEGAAVFEDITPGYYELSISGDGFLDYVEENVRLAHTMDLHVDLADSVAAPLNVRCSQWAVLRWEAPWIYDETREISTYNIYLNGQLHDSVQLTDVECSYTYEGLVNNTDYTAGVSAVYGNDESEVIEFGFHFLSEGDNNAPPVVTALTGVSPNPFNPSATVRFSLAQPGRATLEAFDIRGRLVTTLANDTFEAGEHEVVWSPRNAASGVYLLRLTTGGTTHTTRALLLK